MMTSQDVKLKSLKCYVCKVVITNFKMLENEQGKAFECKCPICHRVYKIKTYFS